MRDGSANLAKIEKHLEDFEAKLKHESEKLQGYNADLKQAERR